MKTHTCPLEQAEAAQAHENDWNSAGSAGTLANLSSNPQITRVSTGERMPYSVISAPRGTQSPGWFDSRAASACSSGYVCVFTPSVLNGTTQYWRVWKLSSLGVYNLTDFVYDGTSYVKNRKTNSAAFRGYEGGAVREQIFCFNPSSGYRGVNYYPAWSFALTSSSC